MNSSNEYEANLLSLQLFNFLFDQKLTVLVRRLFSSVYVCSQPHLMTLRLRIECAH